MNETGLMCLHGRDNKKVCYATTCVTYFFVVDFTTATLYILCGIAALRGYYTMPNHHGVGDLHESSYIVTFTLSVCYILSLLFLMKNHNLEIQYAADATPQPQPTYGTKRPANFFAANFTICLEERSNNDLDVCPKPMQAT